MNRDFVEMLSTLSAEGVDFLVVGGWAMAAHGFPRATKDLDIWLRPTRENARRVLNALKRFGAPLFDLTEVDLAAPEVVFQIGVAPYRIDFVSSIDGVGFDEAWKSRALGTLGGVEVGVIGRSDLIRNKRVVGRPRDMEDADLLDRGEEP